MHPDPVVRGPGAVAVAPDFRTREDSHMSKRDRHAREAPPAPEAQGDGESLRAQDDIGVNETQDATPSHASTEDGDSGVEVLSAQVAEQRDKYLRLAAEYDNYRKRSARERADAASRGQAELVMKLVDALDDLSRFAHVDPATTDPQTLHKGIELVEQKTMKVLESAGLTLIN